MLTFIKELPERSKDHHILWLCKCDCGQEMVCIASRVRFRRVNFCKSCQAKIIAGKIKQHGKRNTAEYKIWIGMKQRCKKGKTREQKSYKLKKILVCEKWQKSFESFFADVGPRPSPKHSLDRIDNSKGYFPGNVRWASASEQQRNKDVSVFVTNGIEKMHINDVALRLGISRGAAHLRLKRGTLYGYTKITRMV